MSKYTMFWSGPFSQWYASPFETSDLLYGKIAFGCAEQYMMFVKAVHFNDYDTGRQILQTDNPKEQKKLGRAIKNFKVEAWDKIKEDVVWHGTINKFRQNPDLLKLLLETRPTTLVEASPYDKIWGIGLAAEHPDAQDETKWQGLNLLGKILTKARDEVVW